MTSVLVDTNVISYMIKGDYRGELYYPHVEDRTICLSFITVAELYRWTVEYSWGPRRLASLDALLQTFALLPHDDYTSWEWARLRNIRGRPVAPSDAWVAATALRHGLDLVTHNRRNFENIPHLKIISVAER